MSCIGALVICAGGLEKSHPKNQVIGVGLRETIFLAPTPPANMARMRRCCAIALEASCASKVFKHMTALKVTAFSPYSEPVSAATKLLGTLCTFPVPATAGDQVFFDCLMASALREAAEGLRNLGCARGASEDASGLAACAASFSHLADRTSAPFACEAASEAIAGLLGTPAPLAVVDAAAFALGRGA
jgi:hypothetical protein